MRINVYAEELTDRVEIEPKLIGGRTFVGLRIFLELPVTVDGKQVKGPFMHRAGDDDSSAVTFWDDGSLRTLLRKAIDELDAYYATAERKK